METKTNPIISKPIIMIDSPEAARRGTVEGWISRDGRFWGEDERTARYVGSTHRKCDNCEAVIPKDGWTICQECKRKSEIQRYTAMPRKVWDGVAMLYSEAADRYFTDPDEAADWQEDDDLDGLRLVICEPVTGRQLDYDYFSDELPEDGELPDELAEAVEAFNKAVIAHGTISWSPGKFALDLSPVEAAPEAGA